MTLGEKFEEILTAFWISNWEDECEKIADEYAIEFGEWCLKIKFEPIENISVKKLLKIYKKEKGL